MNASFAVPGFHVPDGVYLLSHSVGCLPRDAEAVLAERYFRPWREQGGNAWPGWLAEIERFRGAVARLVGGTAAGFCPTANVAGAVARILDALPQRAGRTTLLLCEEDFPSPAYAVQRAGQLGHDVRFLPRGPAAEDIASWDAALDGSVQAALVTHAFSNRSARLPVADITRLARSRDIFTIVDAVQSAGVVPIDVGDWSADFVVGTCVKFLCGGPGAGWLWAAPEALAVSQPRDVGWFSHADPFAMDIRDFRYAPDALRFWGGTPSVAPFILGAHALEMLLAIGVLAIQAHNQNLIDRLHAGVPAGSIASARDRDRRGNCVLVRVPDTAAAMQRLAAANVLADARDGCIRISPHLYSSAADIDRLVAALAL